MGAYNTVKHLVDQGELDIISIMGPSRAGSTILKNIIATSPTIDIGVNQPFHLAYEAPYTPPREEEREEHAYQNILNAYDEARTQKPDGQITMVVKEMARNLGIGAQYDAYDAVVSSHVVAVRNPLLSVESEIKSGVIDYEERPEVFTYNLNLFARRNGYKDPFGDDWQQMKDDIVESGSWGKLARLHKEYNRSFDLNLYQPTMVREYVRSLTDHDAITAGYESLDDFAAQNDFSDWETLRALTEDDDADIEAFQPILDEIFAFSATGWRNTKYIIDKTDPDKLFISDNSLLRIQPEQHLRDLCDALDIEYSDNMVSGINGENTNHNTAEYFEAAFDKLFERAAKSKSVEPPRENPPFIKGLPQDYDKHLSFFAFPAYFSCLANGNAIRPNAAHEINETCNVEIEGEETNLRDRDPVFIYALVASSQELDAKKISFSKEMIRGAYPNFRDEFDAIDQAELTHLQEARAKMQPMRIAQTESLEF